MTDAKRKLIFFWPYLEWGGAQIYFLAIIKEALGSWDIIVVMPRASSAEMIRFIDQTGVKIEFLDFYLDLSSANSIVKKIRRQFRRINIEIASLKFLRRFSLQDCILHIEFPPWQSWMFFLALSLRRANVFVTMHNALPNSRTFRQAIWKLRLQVVSRLPGFHLFTSNEHAKNALRGMVSEKFWKNIKVTYTCVNPIEIKNVVDSLSNKLNIRTMYGVDETRFIVLCVGQFIDRKGRWIFLDAAKIIAKKCPEALFIWLSPSMPSESDRQRLYEYNLNDNFRHVLSENVGSNHIDILKFMSVADVFALPSFVEGLPIALLEAMALGIPSISTNVYAIPEALKNTETGLLIEAGDSTELANAILQLKQDAELRSRISRTGSEFVLQNFDERVASRIALAAYKECFVNG